MTASGALQVVLVMGLGLSAPLLVGKDRRLAGAAATIALAAVALVGYNSPWLQAVPPGAALACVAVAAGTLFWLGGKLGLPQRLRAAPRSLRSTSASKSGEQPAPVVSPAFAEASLREVMTPKAMIAGLACEATAEDAVAEVSRSGHARLVVHEGDLDHIVGVVHVHRLLACTDRSTPVKALARPALFVPESKKCFSMLEEFLREGEQFAVVLDEFGGTAGVVTVEDLLDELVGEMADEHEREEAPVRRMPDGGYLVPGHMKVDDVNERLGLTVPEGDYETISGYILEKLGRVPARGERIPTGGGTLEIVASTARRIVLIKVQPGAPVPAGAGSSGDPELREG